MKFENVKSNLEGLGYAVSVFDTPEAAAEYLNERIDGVSVGIGGSVSVREMGLGERLASHNEVLWHWAMPEGMPQEEMLARAAAAEVYICSVNALAESGEIVNIDGHCNRIASTLYGHKKVYLVVGQNKIAPDLEAAIYRARNVAAPLNAKRLGKRTPCAVKGDRCYNCKSPDRICRAMNVLWQKPTSAEYEILLISADLGY